MALYIVDTTWRNNVCMLHAQYDGSIEILVRESEQLRRTYGHYFDLHIVNNDIDDTLAQLEAALTRLRSAPQWVPVSWVYWPTEHRL